MIIYIYHVCTCLYSVCTLHIYDNVYIMYVHVRFLSEIPDWNSFDKSVLDHALQGLPVPISGPAPQGISLYIRYHIRYRIRYRIRNDMLPSF